MVGGQNKFCGNILLYDYLSSKRAPVFLNRNLTRAFRVHQHLLQHGSTENFPGHELRHTWQKKSFYLSWDSLDEMIESEKASGSFVLQIHGIKSLGSREQEGHAAKKTRIFLRAKSDLRVKIIQQSGNHASFALPSQKATLEGVSRDNNRSVSVETAQVAVRPEDLSDVAGQQTLTGTYMMLINIDLQTQSEAEDLYGHLSCDSKSHNDFATHLSTTWKNILECPRGRTILPLKDWQKQVGFGLEVSMYWSRTKGDTVLTSHNQILRKTTLLQSFLTPESDKGGVLRKYKLTFVYANESLERQGLICPHEGCQRRKHIDIDDLRMHLDAWHDYFQYRAFKEGVDDQGQEKWRFECEVSDHRADQRASAKADEPFDIRQVAPPQPFDRRRYLDAGNDDFQRLSRLDKRTVNNKVMVPNSFRKPSPPRRKPPDQVKDRPLRKKVSYPVPKAPQGVVFVRSCSRRPLITGEYISESDDEVDETWIELRQSAEFEKSKELTDEMRRFLKAFDSFTRDEHLQSDIHLGETLVRFLQAKGTWIWEANVYEAVCVKLEELMQADIISEEVRSWCVQHLKTKKPHMEQSREATDMAGQLERLEVFSSAKDDLYKEPTPPRTSSTENSMTSLSPANDALKVQRYKSFDTAKGKARITDTGNLTPITADSDGDIEMRREMLAVEATNSIHETNKQEVPPYDLCLCGEDAQTSHHRRQLVACNNMVSSLHQSTIKSN